MLNIPTGFIFFGIFFLTFGFSSLLVKCAYDADKSNCESKNGHLIVLYKSTMCITHDGRIMER